MSGAERAVVDQAVRDRVTADLTTTFLLEASAGTGKTRVLVDRYVRCVLDPEHGTGDVRTVAAITFTEKAAGELRQRVREEFERWAVSLDPATPQAEMVGRALDALDDAPISTIHSFAGRLLRELPVEAGVDPAFEQLDALASDLERRRLWDDWLGQLAGADAGERPVRAWLMRLLRAGVRLDDIRALAVGARGIFDERYDIDPLPAPPPEPDLRGALHELLFGPLDRLRDYCGAACTEQSDKGFCKAMDLVDAVDELLAGPPADTDRLAGLLFALPVSDAVSAPGGQKGNWSAAAGGKEGLQTCYQELVAAVAAVRESYSNYVTGLALAVADSFARWAADTQISLGNLDFTDLLGRLRDLLKNDRSTRATLQDRFRYLLVDEFQDTDPLQAEIVFFLCERRPLAADWRRVVLQPGKLFVVGDPKQSIYRFRRADIAMYDEVKEVVENQPHGSGMLAAISQNFRTTPSAVAWVNRVFHDVFETDKLRGRQPGYQAVHAYRPGPNEPRVAVLMGRVYGGRGAGENEAARRDEARAVAGLLREMHDPGAVGWHVQDRGEAEGATAGAAEGRRAAAAEATRPPRWGDIALLFRATTGLETYEQALREAGVPYRVDGGATYFERREVADALLCLRAVDDPADAPAVYGALHSTFFGFSDDDLFLFSAAGGRFDPFAAAQPQGHEGIVAALGTLRTLHERRADHEPHELAASLIRLTNAAELAAATGSGAPQAIANLEKLVERARAFCRASGGGLGAFLQWAAEAGDAAGEQESQVDDQGDVVRLLTIHKAKGLEYPIVVLVGGALAGGRGGRETVRPIVDRARRRLAVKLKAELPGGSARDLEPRTYRELKEREDAMDESEMRRLLYVAATRARDRLVLTCFGKLTTQKGEPAAHTMLAVIGTTLPASAEEACREDGERHGLLVLAPRTAAAPAGRGAAPAAGALIAARRDWQTAREALLATARRTARATSPSGLEHVDEAVAAGGPGAPPGRATALALGSAVHEIMELCDLVDAASVDATAAAVTAALGRPDLAGRATELAAACWRSRPVRAAAGSPLVYRELPVGALVDETVVSGAVDLLYLAGEQWVIVDYKTDRDADEAVLRERYLPQGAAYAVAVERATGRAVREVVLVAAAAGGLAVPIAVDDALRASVSREIAAAVDERRPIGADELGQAG